MAEETLSLVFQAVGTGAVISATTSLIGTIQRLPSAIGEATSALFTSSSALEAITRTASAVTSVLAGTVTAVVGAATAFAGASAEIIRIGDTAGDVAEKFAGLSQKLGVDTAAALISLREATQGAVTDLDLQRIAVKALSGESGITVTQLATLTDAVFRSARGTMDFGAAQQILTRALLTGRTAALEQVQGFRGVSAAVDEAKRALEAQGVTVTRARLEQITLTEVMNRANSVIREIPKETAGAGLALGRLTTFVANLRDEFSRQVEASPAIQAALERLRAIAVELAPGILRLAEGVTTLIAGFGGLAARIVSFTTSSESLRGFFAGLLRVIIDVGKEISSALGDSFRELAPVLKTTIEQVRTFAGPVLRALGSVLATVIRAATPVVAVLLDFGNEVRATVVPQVLKLVDAVKPLVVQIGEGLARALRVVLPVIGVAMKGAITGVTTAIRILAPILTFMQGAFNRVADAVRPVVEFIHDLVNTLATGAGVIGDFLGSIFGGDQRTLEFQLPTIEVAARVDVTADPERIAQATREGVLDPLTAAIVGIADRLAVSNAANAANLQTELS